MAERQRDSGLWLNGNGHAALAEFSPQQYADTVQLLTERLAELELSYEDVGWRQLGSEGHREFSREGLRRIQALARLMFLKNPLINRAVTLQASYVFGQGMQVQARHPSVNAVVQAFWDDAANQSELTSHQSRTLKEQELQVTGNLFFAFFVHPATGRVRARTIPADEVTDILCNPDDGKEPWFYRRDWMQAGFDPQRGPTAPEARHAYHPDWRYRPADRPATVGGAPVAWDIPVYHVKVGGLPDMRFGVPEVYSALDWARAYKGFLEDWATITRALSRFAFHLTTKGGKAGVAAAKAKLGTTLGTSNSETNPPPLTGSIAISTEGAKLEPIRTAGVTTSAEDGRRLLLMVAAATGMPESFFGDVSVGTLATARSLDRPTELKFRDRQTLWGDVFVDILQFVVDRAALAPRGPLQGSVARNAEGDGVAVVLAIDPDTNAPMDRRITCAWPSILEHDQQSGVQSVVDAATLGGHPAAGTLDPRTTTRLLLQALGEPDIDELLAQMFPDPVQGGQQGQGGAPGAPAVEARLAEILTAQAGVLRAWVTSGLSPRELLAAEDVVDGVRP